MSKSYYLKSPMEWKEASTFHILPTFWRGFVLAHSLRSVILDLICNKPSYNQLKITSLAHILWRKTYLKGKELQTEVQYLCWIT